MIEDFRQRDQPILFYHVKPKIVSTFLGVNPKDFKYCNNEDDLNDMLKGLNADALFVPLNRQLFSSHFQNAQAKFTLSCNAILKRSSSQLLINFVFELFENV
jgi:hypothetical protein